MGAATGAIAPAPKRDSDLALGWLIEHCAPRAVSTATDAAPNGVSYGARFAPPVITCRVSVSGTTPVGEGA